MAPTPSDLPVERVVAALLLQVAGYAAVLVLFPHGNPTGLVDTLAGVPPVVLIPLAVPAVPATVLTVALGAVLAAAGVSSSAIPPIALARGDVLFFASATAVAVAAAWADERTAE